MTEPDDPNAKKHRKNSKCLRKLNDVLEGWLLHWGRDSCQ